MPRHTRQFRRPMLESFVSRLQEPRGFVQVLAGPRQTGKKRLWDADGRARAPLKVILLGSAGIPRQRALIGLAAAHEYLRAAA